MPTINKYTAGLISADGHVDGFESGQLLRTIYKVREALGKQKSWWEQWDIFGILETFRY